jgi:rod shape determining protein RodA
MSITFKKFDKTLLVCSIILMGFGTAVIGSVAPTLVGSQILFYIVGLVLFFLFSQIDPRIYKSIWKQTYVVSIFLLLLTLILGLESRGATRWISLGGFRLQFSEILKPFLMISLVPLVKSPLFLIIAAIPMLLIFKQPDLGSALVYLVGSSFMIFVSGINLWYIFSAIISFVIFLPIVWHFLAQYQRNRIFSFINPQVDPLGVSYNAIQAVIAVGSGMFFGKGLGLGTQSQLLFLPEHHTDFIFASTAEELGFLGAGLLLIVYFILIIKIFKNASGVNDTFARLLIVSLGGMIFAQVFINVGMNLGILPVTGITLPLVSYGGSSILSVMISLGIISGAYCFNE